MLRDLEWVLDVADRPACGAPRADGSLTLCEHPPDHMIGEFHDENHFGRDRFGRWQTWPAVPVVLAEIGAPE